MRRVASKHGARGFLVTGAALGLALAPISAFAQEEAPSAAPAAAEAPAEPAAAATPAEPAAAPEAPAPRPLLAQVTAGAVPEATVVEEAPPPPAPPDDSGKPIAVRVWGRIGNVIQSAKNSEELTDLSQNAEVDLFLLGQIHKYIKWQADFVATYGSGNVGGQARILDLIGKLEPSEHFNVWFGRMLVPSDRSNFSGPWFMGPWNYPGVFSNGYAGPRQGPFGRNDGATVWGQLGGGTFKYYAGAFDLGDGSQSPLYSGRLNLALINPEPGFFHSSTYYGSKDILAFGVSAQFKKDGSVGPTPMADPTMPGVMPAAPVDNYMGFSADVLFEKNLGGAGVIDLEGAFYSYQGDYEVFKYAFYGLASYLVPVELGIGKLQPLVRFQGAGLKAADTDMARIIDAQVGYVITEYAARLALGYQNSSAAGTKSNAVFLGLQLMK